MTSKDTIAAIATPPGRGGVGIVRVSGSNVVSIAKAILSTLPKPRQVHFGDFKATDNSLIDIGLALYFKAPHSFTGEDVLELHGHGGPIVMDRILQTVVQHGARLAKPGEFSERAFLNDKIDLAQAEAIADLIDSASEQAAKGAVRSLQGEFSKKIHTLLEQLIHFRVYVEAAIDFPEEEIDFLSDGKVAADLKNLIAHCEAVRESANMGAILQEGMTIVIAGKPNAGKSTLLNCLSGRDSAIVTDIPGTTRDVMREYISLDGIPLHVIDTAGLRESDDLVEQEGIKRAWQEIEKADLILLLVDVAELAQLDERVREFQKQSPDNIPLTVVVNKIDKSDRKAQIEDHQTHQVIYLSAKENVGIDLLQTHLKNVIGFHDVGEGLFSARRRHLDAIDKALAALKQGAFQLEESQAGELLAEECRLAQNALSEITGEFSADDLLGQIFSSFCIGK